MKRMAVLVAVMLAMGLGMNSYAKESKDVSAVSTVSGGKFGYVDLNRALNEVNEGKTAKAQLEADGKTKKQKLDILQNDLKKMKEDIDKQRLILSAEAVREKEMQFQQKFVEFQKMGVDFEKEFSEKEASYIKPISDKLQLVIKKIGDTEGYTMIVPREMALYSPSGTDLTDKVIESYNTGK